MFRKPSDPVSESVSESPVETAPKLLPKISETLSDSYKKPRTQKHFEVRHQLENHLYTTLISIALYSLSYKPKTRDHPATRDKKHAQ